MCDCIDEMNNILAKQNGRLGLENVRRGAWLATQQSKQTHCKHGHELTPENTAIKKRGARGGSQRRCRTCMTRESREREARRAPRGRT